MEENHFAATDYMQSPEFAETVERVVELANSERCALMCAKRFPGDAIDR
jgi:hypothetical protein